MRVELGAPVIVVSIDGVGDGGLWHVPVETIPGRAYPGSTAAAWLSLKHRWTNGALPDEWPTLCGLAGPLYVYEGGIRKRHCCTVCLRKAPDDLVVPGVDPLPSRDAGGGDRGYRPPKWKHSRLKPHHVRLLHRIYLEEKIGVRALGERVYQQLGYSSSRVCGDAIYRGFVALSLPTRTQSEGTALKNLKHGRRRRALGETGPAVQDYRRWLKEQRGAYRPQCQGVKSQPPRKGQRCTRPAMTGSDYCYSHDPSLAAERRVHIERMWARQPGRVTGLAEAA